MGNVTLAEVESLARKILTTYFCDSDLEFLISTFADDIIWLGGGEKQKAEGKEAVAACFRSGKDGMIACDMSEESYHCMDLGGGAYLCEGVSWLRSKPGSEFYVNMQQRVTFVFRETDEGLKAVHIHNSVPYQAIKEDELFPIESSREEFIRLQSALNIKNQEFENQAQFLERLYDTIPCGILQFTTDPGHRVVALNPMTWKFYGYDSEEAYRRDVTSPLDNVEEEDRGRVLAAIDRLTLNGENASYRRRCVRRDGQEAWISVVMGRIVNSDGQEVIQAVFTDITEQMRLEKAQEQERILENRFLRAAIYTAYPLIMSLNLTRNTYSLFVDEQDSYTIQGEGTYADLVENSLPMIYPSYQEDYRNTFRREEILRRFEAGEREIYMEMQQKGDDGEYHWLSVHVIAVENPFNDDVLAIDLVKLLDSQRQEQARQQQLLRDALASANAASRAKSDFLSRMSHDIRTPMNAIIGMTTIGQLKLEDSQVVRDCFRKIDTSSKYLLSLINDILDMSRIETDKMEIAHELFDFKAFAEELNQIIYPQTLEKEVGYEMRHREPLESHYIGDSLRMKQILMNLLSNALKFTPPGGKLGVDIREEKRANGFAYLEFMVWDNGIGMSEEFMQRIFQPFEQENPGNARNNVGSGLGLSIVYNLVQLMGGTIGVESEKDKGSTFTVTIPFRLVSDNQEREWERKRQNLLKGFEVLVVDDDPAVGRQTAVILEDIGARTVWADSGYRAVEEVQISLRQDRMFDIAMIDWKMPGIDGIETARRIRNLVGGDTMIIMITAYDWSGIEAEARAAGIDYFIAKPLFRSAIYDTFSKLDKRNPEPSGQCDPGLAGKRFLLAEDNELNREIAVTLLEMNGAAVDTAVNGREALDFFGAREPGTYDAVLMDIRMPVMDGLEACMRIRAMDRGDGASVPILAMTANAFEEDKKKAFAAGMTGYLVKPLDIRLLVEELKRCLG